MTVLTITPGKMWTVPSRTSDEEHVIRLVNGVLSCSCSDHFWRGNDCHHIKIVRITLQTEAIAATTTADAKRRDLGLYLLTGGRQGQTA